ncbi:MAG: type II toxin-antitoxin system VapC family toxin [Pseudonocardiaceae bacterium]
MGQAVEFIDQLLSSPTVRVLGTDSRHWELRRKILDKGQVRGGLVADAVIVALCAEDGLDTVLSSDRDVDRFPGIRVARLASCARAPR